MRAERLAPIAAPQLILYKDNASARAMELALIAEPQLMFYKDNVFLTKGQVRDREFCHRRRKIKK